MPLRWQWWNRWSYSNLSIDVEKRCGNERIIFACAKLYGLCAAFDIAAEEKVESLQAIM